jgi:hypothetical protein
LFNFFNNIVFKFAKIIIDENQTKIFNNIGTKLINKYKDNYDNAISNLNKLAIDNIKLFNLIMIDD